MFRFYLYGLFVSFCTASLWSADSFRLIAPAITRPGLQVPVRIETISDERSIIKDQWQTDGVIIVRAGPPPWPTNRVQLVNGMSVVSAQTVGTNDLDLSVTGLHGLGDRTVKNAPAEETAVGGTLAGTSTIWRGVVRVTNDVTVPSGHTLRIEPGTLVLIEGATSGTSANDLLVSGAVESLGTESGPVWITAAATNSNWGQIRHSSGSRGVYRYTFIHKGGRTAGEGHTGTGPVLRLSGANVRLEHCVIYDLWNEERAIGKGMYARNSELVIDDTVFSRMRMGPEIEGTSLLCTNSYFMEMRGPDDCDGIYLHDSDGKSLVVADSVFAGGDDDGVDTLDADLTVRNCVFRGWLNESEDAKAISVFNGSVRVERSLIADCFSGISAKASEDASAAVQVNHCTIVTKTNGVAAAWKSNAPGPNIAIGVTNSIVVATPAIFSSFDTTNVNVGYSFLSTTWPGTNVSLENPHFAYAEGHDYRLFGTSPAIDFSDPASAPDADGSRADAGYLAYRAPSASIQIYADNAAIAVHGSAVGRTIITEHSPDLKTWTEVRRLASHGLVHLDLIGLGFPIPKTGFYRFRFE